MPNKWNRHENRDDIFEKYDKYQTIGTETKTGIYPKVSADKRFSFHTRFVFNDREDYQIMELAGRCGPRRRPFEYVAAGGHFSGYTATSLEVECMVWQFHSSR